MKLAGLMSTCIRVTLLHCFLKITWGLLRVQIEKKMGVICGGDHFGAGDHFRAGMISEDRYIGICFSYVLQNAVIGLQWKIT